jgi:hypothetical protein
MTMRRLAPLLALLLGLAALGCASNKHLLMGTGEYGVYRKTRLSRTLEDRLTASYDYITAYPEGEHAEQVRAAFLKDEALYFSKAKSSIKGLKTYLSALPKGPHAQEAIDDLRRLQGFAEAQRSGITGAAKATNTELAREVERRQAVRDRVELWIAVFLDPKVFAKPLSEAKAALIVPWSLSLPWPVCARAGTPDVPKPPPGGVRRCTKLLQFDYRAVEDGEAQERQALVEIGIWYDEDGRPVEVTLAGPELFLRLQETVTARGAASDDPDAKLAGAERAVEMAQSAFGATLSADASCKKTGDSEVLRLACKGIELRVLASALDGEDDRFVIRPAP